MLNIHYNRIFCKTTLDVFVEMGRERPLCPALPIEQLHPGQGRCGMKRRFEGLHQTDQSAGHDVPDGLFLVRVQRAQYRWHPQKPFYHLRFVVLEPQQFEGRPFGARVYCSSKALWKLAWFLHDFGYDADLLGHDEVDDKNLVRTPQRGQDQPHRSERHHTTQPRRFCSGKSVGRAGYPPARCDEWPGGSPMNFSYTQISQYRTCLRRYRYRYLDGWKQKDNRASMMFGRAFEQALGALFRREDPGQVFFHEWSAFKNLDLEFSGCDSWIECWSKASCSSLDSARRTASASRQPHRHLQIKVTKHLSERKRLRRLSGCDRQSRRIKVFAGVED